MKALIYVILGLMSVLMLSNCYPTPRFAPTDAGMIYETRVSPGEIKVYRSSVPDIPYMEIGSVYVCCDRDADVLVNALKKKAAACGGDAIIDLEPYPDGMSATVIRFK